MSSTLSSGKPKKETFLVFIVSEREITWFKLIILRFLDALESSTSSGLITRSFEFFMLQRSGFTFLSFLSK